MEMNITVTGFQQFHNAMSTLASELPKVIQLSSLEAAKLTVNTARPTVPVKSGKAAASLQAYVVGDGAIAEGGNSLDYYHWLEYGGASGRKHANIRPIVSDGRYISPAYQKIINQVQQFMNQNTIQAISDAGLA